MMLKYLALWVLCMWHLLLRAQGGPAYSVSLRHYGLRDGLSNERVQAIAEDERGLIWVGTNHGLNRFDGHRFTMMGAAGHRSESEAIKFLFSEGAQMWVFYGYTNHLVQEVDVVDIRDGSARPFAAHMAGKLPFDWSALSHAWLLHDVPLFKMQDGQVWAYHRGQGFQRLAGLAADMELLKVYADGSRWAYRRSAQGAWELVKQNPQGKGLSAFSLPWLDNVLLNYLHEEGGESYWSWSGSSDHIGDDEVFVFDGAVRRTLFGNHLRDWEGGLQLAHYLRDLGLYGVFEQRSILLFDRAGQLCFHEAFEGVKTLTGRLQVYAKGARIYLATDSGLYVLSVNKHLFGRHSIEGACRGIARAAGRLWLVESDRVVAWAGQPVVPETRGMALWADADTLWTAQRQRLSRFVPTTGQVTRFEVPFSNVWSGKCLPGGQILMGGDLGLWVFDPRRAQGDNLAAPAFPELAQGIVYAILPREDGHYWLCSTTGLYAFDPATLRVLARYWSGGRGRYHLPADDVRHLVAEPGGQVLWLATGGRGLWRWDRARGEAEQHLFAQPGTNTLHAVYGDERGFLWLSSDDGLVQFDKRSGRHRIYRTEDGLGTNEFNRISHFQDADGRLYFGAVEGAYTFHPRDFWASFQMRREVRPIVVDAHQYLGASNRVERVTAALLKGQRLLLRSDDRFLTLTLGLSSTDLAYDAQYAYQLEGRDTAWLPIEGNSVTFGRLPYGTQSIRIKALLADGDQTGVLQVPLRVAWPFYLTWWFWSALGLALVLFIYWRLDVLQRRTRQLQAEVARRTQDLSQANQRLAEQAEGLKALDRMKSRFFANISHELRTPLTLISGPLQQLAAQPNEAGRGELVQFAYRNSQRLLRLVNQILDLTKLEAARLEVSAQDLAILPFLRRVLAEFESLAAHKGLALHLDAALPPGAVAHLDAEKLETILYNLLSNAIKFTPAGGTVCLRASAAPGLCFEVADTGRGIHPEDLPHIFERFYQSRYQDSAAGGTGIGLALCAELAALMRGELRAESRDGEGSRFRLALPQQLRTPEGQRPEQAPAPAQPQPASAAAPPAAEDAERPLVLLVEDNPDLQAYTALALQAYCRVALAGNGVQALAYLENCGDALPDLVLSDIMMPEMDGWQLLAHLRADARYRGLPLLLLTARASLEDRLQGLRMGVDDYLTKPFVEAELLARVRNLIERVALRRLAGAGEAGAEADEDPETPLQEDEWLLAVQAYVLAHLISPTFSVATLAEAFGMSRFAFNRRLGLAVGLSPSDYVQEIRLLEAKRLLEQRAVGTVREAVASVGVGDAKAFSRRFFHRFGVYPSAYLKD